MYKIAGFINYSFQYKFKTDNKILKAIQAIYGGSFNNEKSMAYKIWEN